MNKLQDLLSSNCLTAPMMRGLAYLKNDVFGPKFTDLLIPKLIPGWREMRILDVGCGWCKIEKDRRFRGTDITCFDIYAPYLVACKQSGLKTVRGDARNLQNYFPLKSFDIVWLFDIVEHFTKTDGVKLLARAEKLAKKQIIIWAPYGWYPQDFDVMEESWQVKDKKLLSRNPFQQHKSSWIPVDFTKRGYVVEVLHNYHPDIRSVSRELSDKKEPVTASQMWAIKNMSLRGAKRRGNPIMI